MSIVLRRKGSNLRCGEAKRTFAKNNFRQTIGRKIILIAMLLCVCEWVSLLFLPVVCSLRYVGADGWSHYSAKPTSLMWEKSTSTRPLHVTRDDRMWSVTLCLKAINESRAESRLDEWQRRKLRKKGTFDNRMT